MRTSAKVVNSTTIAPLRGYRNYLPRVLATAERGQDDDDLSIANDDDDDDDEDDDDVLRYEIINEGTSDPFRGGEVDVIVESLC
jgi:hypothetical protein